MRPRIHGVRLSVAYSIYWLAPFTQPLALIKATGVFSLSNNLRRYMSNKRNGTVLKPGRLHAIPSKNITKACFPSSAPPQFLSVVISEADLAANF